MYHSIESVGGLEYDDNSVKLEVEPDYAFYVDRGGNPPWFDKEAVQREVENHFKFNCIKMYEEGNNKDNSDDNEKPREGYIMKNIYRVIVMSVEEEKILDKEVNAEDKGDARFEAGVDQALRDNNLKPKDVTVIVNKVGSFEVEEEEEPQKVKVVED